MPSRWLCADPCAARAIDGPARVRARRPLRLTPAPSHLRPHSPAAQAQSKALSTAASGLRYGKSFQATWFGDKGVRAESGLDS
jgi:hypothetical protein